VAEPGKSARLEIFSQEGQKDTRASKGESLGFALPPPLDALKVRRTIKSSVGRSNGRGAAT